MWTLACRQALLALQYLVPESDIEGFRILESHVLLQDGFCGIWPADRKE